MKKENLELEYSTTPKTKKDAKTSEKPSILLIVIRKIISKIFMNRKEDKINRHLAQSQYIQEK